MTLHASYHCSSRWHLSVSSVTECVKAVFGSRDSLRLCELLAECVAIFQQCWEAREVTHIGRTHVTAMQGIGCAVGIGKLSGKGIHA